jgi:hypothetical protein
MTQQFERFRNTAGLVVEFEVRMSRRAKRGPWAGDMGRLGPARTFVLAQDGKLVTVRRAAGRPRLPTSTVRSLIPNRHLPGRENGQIEYEPCPAPNTR